MGRPKVWPLYVAFAVVVLICLALGWQSYLLDYDWDPASYVVAVRDGKWFVDLGYGRLAYLLILRPVRWILSLWPNGATFNSVYYALKIIHLGFSLLLIGFWYGLASRLFDKRTAMVGSPLLLLNVPFLTFTSRVWTEIPMLAGVYGALWIWLVLVWHGRERRQWVAGMAIVGAVLAVSALVREVGVFFFPAFVVPLLVRKDRRKAGWIAGICLLAAAGLVFMVYSLVRHYLPAYDRAVENIETYFPTTLAPGEIAGRTGQVGQVLIRHYLISGSLCLISLIYLAARREWPMATLLLCMSLVPLIWILFKGGTFYARYVMPAAPGLALGCLPVISRLEVQRHYTRQRVLAVILIIGLLGTADWTEIRICKYYARVTRHHTRRWVERAASESGPTTWMVGSFTEVMHGLLTDGDLNETNSLYWPSWSGRYEQITPTLIGNLGRGRTVYVHLNRDAYSGDYEESLETLKDEFLLVLVEPKTHLYRLQMRPVPESTVRVDFVSETSWEFLGEGFDRPERWSKDAVAVWANGKKAVLTLRSNRLPRLKAGNRAIRVELRWFCLDRPGSPVVDGYLDVTCGEYMAHEDFQFPPGESLMVVTVPRQADPDTEIQITMNFSSLWVPAKTFAESGDPRTLATALFGITLVPISE